MIIDVSAGVGEWPFMPLGDVSPEGLSATMRAEGVQVALVSPVEGICSKNPHAVNEAHYGRLRPYPHLLPIPVINPRLGDMEEQVGLAHEQGVPAVKVYPNYHGYSPGCDDMDRLLAICSEFGLALMVQIRVEDARGQHPALQVPDVNVVEVLDIIETREEVPVILCGTYSLSRRNLWSPDASEASAVTEDIVERIVQRSETYIETSFMESLDTLKSDANTLNRRYDRVLLGTHHPFFYMRANVVKLEAIAEDTHAHEAIAWRNAARIFDMAARLPYLETLKELWQ